ncbi:SLOG family protein [Amphibacillus sp. Q70]|uniref:SLOG family protein n=1 Tax=Amphibacillus sp. Q70 TaxID=3453416 RepID=UPI003F839F91
MRKIMAVTGYKSYELNVRSANDQRLTYIKYALKQRIIAFIENGGEWIITSGQLGIELWACEIVDELKQDYDIKYAIIPPFNNQDKKWAEADQQLYQRLIHTADYYALLYKDDYKGPGQFTAKNQWLIEKSDCCLILVDDEYPGSVSYFLEQAKPYSEVNDYLIDYITSFDLNEVINEIQPNDLNS